MRLFIILHYLFRGYGKSIFFAKEIQEQQQYSLSGIYEHLDFLQRMTYLLLNEKNELHNRDLHISGLLNTEKVDIEEQKVDIRSKKVDIESVLSEKGKDFSIKTTVHIRRLFEKFGYDEVFGRSAVTELLN